MNIYIYTHREHVLYVFSAVGVAAAEKKRKVKKEEKKREVKK